MSDLQKFKEYDEEELHKKTYIAPKVIKALQEEDFRKIGNRHKVMGFINIIERETGLDLAELKERVDEQLGHGEQPQNAFEIKEKITTNTNKNPILYIFLFIIVLVAGAYYFFVSTKEQKSPSTKDMQTSSIQKSSSSNIESALLSTSSSIQSVILAQSEENISSSPASLSQSSLSQQAQVDTNESNRSSEESSSSSQAILPSITIIPKKKLWIGIIYLDNYQKKAYVTSSPIEINTSRDQLIVTGHGLFKIDIDGKVKDLQKRGKQRFIYRAGELEPIDAATFRLYNRGKNW